MIKYFSATKMLEHETKDIPQLNGSIIEEVDIDSYNSGYQYFFEFLCPKGDKYMSMPIEFLDTNVGKLVVPFKVFSSVGKVYFQLVIRDNNSNIINKSLLSKMPYCIVSKSVNATIQEPNEFGYDFVGSCLKARDDCVKVKEECKNTTNIIKSQAEESFLMAKGGTVVKVNNKVEKDINFSSMPQEQLNELKNMTMVPSKNKIENIMPNKQDEDYSYWTAIDNGYINIILSSKTYGLFRISINSNIKYFMNIKDDRYANVLFPVKKGDKILCYFPKENKIASFISVFIYAEEVR